MAGHAARPSARPTSRYLAAVARAAERAGAARDPDPDGHGERLVRARRAVHGELDHRLRARRDDAPHPPAGGRQPGRAAAGARRPPGRDARARSRPGRIAINLVAGGGPDAGYGAPPLDHAARYARLGELADALRERFAGPALPGRRERGRRGAGRRRGRHVPDVGRAARRDRRRGSRAMRGRAAGRPMRFGLRIHLIARDTDARGPRRRRPSCCRAPRSPATAPSEYAAFDSVGQARMNAIAADGEGWVAPGPLGRHPGRARRRGHRAGGLPRAGWRGCSATYRDAGVDLVIGSGYPHLEEVAPGGPRVWPRLHAPRGGARDPARSTPARRAGPPSWPSASAPRSTCSTAPAWRPRRGRSRRRPGPDVDRRLLDEVQPADGPGRAPAPGGLLGRGGLGLRVPGRPPRRRARVADRLQRPPQDDGRAAPRAGGGRHGRSPTGAEQVREIARLAAHAAPGRAGRPAPASRPTASGRDRFGVPAAPGAGGGVGARAAPGLPLTGLHIHLGAYQLGPLPPSGPPIHGVTVQYPVPVVALRRRGARGCARRPSASAASSGSTWAAGGRRGRGLAAHLDAVRAALGPGRPAADPGARPRADPRRGLAAGAGGRAARARARWWSTPASPRCRACCGSARRCTPPSRATGAERPTDLFGPLCLQHDAIAREVPLPPLRVGDLVWIGQTGAYAMAQASPFIHLRPGAVLVEGGRAATAARAARPTTRRSARRPSRCWWAPRAGRCPRRDRGPRPRRPLGRQRQDDGRRPRGRGGRRRRARLLLHGHARQPRGGARRWACTTPRSTAPGPDDLVIAVQGDGADAGARRGRGGARPAPAGRRRRRPAPRARRAAWRRAEGDLAVISVPGEYAALEAHKALGAGMDVLLFSDGVAARGRGRAEAPRPRAAACW